MKIAVLGGAGAMGALYGGNIAEVEGNDVTLVDVWREAVDAINERGLKIEEMSGETRVILVKATTDPKQVGPVDLLIVFVKGYSTKEAIRNSFPMINKQTTVLTLQNGPSNVNRIIDILGKNQVMAGVTVHSSTVLGPGHIKHAGWGTTYIGELDGTDSERLKNILNVLTKTGFEVVSTNEILKISWQKLSLNVCALPLCGLLRFYSGELLEHKGTMELMRGLLQEIVAVAQIEGISLDFEERWEAITKQLKLAAGARASMLQDIEKHRKTEIDMINGAIVEIGRNNGIAVPFNNAMVWMVKSLEETF